MPKTWYRWLALATLVAPHAVGCGDSGEEGYFTVSKLAVELATPEEIEAQCGTEPSCESLCGLILERRSSYGSEVCEERGDTSYISDCTPGGESLLIDCTWLDEPSGCAWPSG